MNLGIKLTAESRPFAEAFARAAGNDWDSTTPGWGAISSDDRFVELFNRGEFAAAEMRMQQIQGFLPEDEDDRAARLAHEAGAKKKQEAIRAVARTTRVRLIGLKEIDELDPELNLVILRYRRGGNVPVSIVFWDNWSKRAGDFRTELIEKFKIWRHERNKAVWHLGPQSYLTPKAEDLEWIAEFEAWAKE